MNFAKFRPVSAKLRFLCQKPFFYDRDLRYSPLLSVIRHISLQNSIIRNLRFCSFSGRLNSRKALTAIVRHASTRRFLPRHDAVRPLRLFRNANFRHFQTPVFVPKSCRFPAVRPSRGRNGAVVAMQRRPRCDAVRPPLQRRKALTASP